MTILIKSWCPWFRIHSRKQHPSLENWLWWYHKFFLLFKIPA